MKKKLLKSFLLAVCLLVGTSAWGAMVTMRSWDFTGLSSNTSITTSETTLTASSTTCNLATLPSCCEGLYFQESWICYKYNDSNPGLRNVSNGDRMVIIPNLKEGDVVTITGNDDAINNINSTPSDGTKDAEKKTLTFTMSVDGNFYFKMVRSGATVNSSQVYPSIKSIVVSRDYTNVFTQNYSGEDYASGWSAATASRVGWAQYTRTDISGETTALLVFHNGDNNGASSTYSSLNSLSPYQYLKDWCIEFDAAFQGCYGTTGSNQNASVAINTSGGKKVTFQITTIKNSGAGNNGYILANDNSTLGRYYQDNTNSYNDGTGINSTNSATKFVLTKVYHITITGNEGNGVNLTITGDLTSSSGVSVNSLSYQISEDFERVTTFVFNSGRGAGQQAMLDNLTVGINSEILNGYNSRATAAKSTYTSINAMVMNSSVKTALDNAYNTLNTDYDTNEEIIANFGGYCDAIEALENAIVAAQTSINDFIILNDLIENANSFAETVTSYEAPTGASAVYVANADVDPVALATAVRAEIIEEGTKNPNTDISALIVNKGFELETTIGWNIDGEPATGGSDADNNGCVVTTDVIEGNYTYYTGWNGRNVNQRIVGLPAGRYKLTAKARSWTNGEWRCTVALVANGSASDPVTMEGGNTDLEYTFTVTGNETYVNIGIAGTNGASSPYPSGGTWGYYCDDFTLTILDPILSSNAVEFTNGETLTANKWYYFDATASNYVISAGSSLSSTIYTTDGEQFSSSATGSPFTRNLTMTATRYYFKSSVEQTLSFNGGYLYYQDFTADDNGGTSTDVTDYGYTVVDGTNTTVNSNKLQFSSTDASSSSAKTGEVYTVFDAVSTGVVNISFTWNATNATGARGKTATTDNSTYTSFYLADDEGNKIMTVYYFGQMKRMYVNGLRSDCIISKDNTNDVTRGQTFTVTATIDMDNKIIRSLKLVGTSETIKKNNFAFENTSATSLARFGFKNRFYDVFTPTIDDIEFRNNEVNYTLNAILEGGSHLKTIYKNYSDFSSSEVVSFPKSIYVNNKWYTTSETTYAKTFTEAGTQTVTYAEDDSFDYYFEFEELPKNGSFAAQLGGENVSNGGSGRLYKSTRAWTSAITGGTYTLNTQSRGANNNATISLYICDTDGSNPYYIGEATKSGSTSSWGISTTMGIVIPEGKALCFYNNDASNNHNHYVDYLTLTRTGDATVSATLGANGFTTFASVYPLDLANLPTGLTAYKAAVDAVNNKVLFTPVTEAVQANTGLLLKGTSTEYDVPVVASGSDISASNALLVNTGGNTFTAESGYTYYGMIKDSNPLTFGTFNPSSVAIPANKAYLKVSTTIGSRLIASFDDDATAVFDLNDKSEMTNDKWYDLQGRRIDGSRLNPGIYIVNGRKVVVK